MFCCIFHISPSISILCQRFYLNNCCKVIFAIKLCTSLTYAELCATSLKSFFKIFSPKKLSSFLQNRSLDHSAGSHGTPGIYVKYDLSPLGVSVLEVHQPFWQLIIRLCGIIGGVFATSGMK